MTHQQIKSLSQKRWTVLVVSCLINLCIGSIYTWSVFSLPMAEYLTSLGQEVTTGDLSIVFTVANSVGPVTLISGGFINDKIGPRWVVFAGGIVFGGGLLLSGFATSVPVLVITYGLLCGLGMGLVYGCTVSNSVKFFPDKRGLVGGIATASYGISSVLVPPIANALIERYGVLAAFKILGILFAVIICAGAFLVEKCPETFVPLGHAALSKQGGSAATTKNWKQMLQTPAFYIMLLLLCCGAVSGLMTISQISPIAQTMVGMSVPQATVAVSVLALFNTVGRVAAGYIADRIGSVNTLVCMLFLSVVGLLLMYGVSAGRAVMFYIGVALIGLCFGAFMGVFPGFTAAQFGSESSSVNYGIIFIGFAAAGYLGPTIMNAFYKRYAGYRQAFLFAAALSLLGIVLAFIYKKLGKPEKVERA